MSIKADKARAAILRALDEAGRPLGASRLVGPVAQTGLTLQPRTIRHYLLQLDSQGLTRLVSRRSGRVLTEQGRREAVRVASREHFGIVAAKLETLSYRMTLSSLTGRGSVIVNLSLVAQADFDRTMREIQLVADRGMSVSRRVLVAKAGMRVGSVIVPEGMVGIGTVCSITLNGIFRQAGIPVVSRFAGLLEVVDRQHTRFLDMIAYNGCTLDPLEIFIRADMTSVRNVVLRGTGIICASFRELPSAAAPDIKAILNQTKAHEVGGLIALGQPNQPLLGIPVSEGHCGIVITGGLNPIAAVSETGIRLVSHSSAGLEDYSKFKTTREVIRAYRT